MTSSPFGRAVFRGRDHFRIRDMTKGRKSMRDARTRILAAGLLLFPAVAARAENKCLVRAVFGGKPVTLKNCAAAMYDEKGVTLFFNENAIPAEEAAAFQLNSYP